MPCSPPLPSRPLQASAGLLYLVIILCGVWSEGALRGGLIFPDQAEQTARAIGAALPWWRLGLAADLAMILADVAIGAVFLRLFAARFALLAPMAFGFRLAQAAVIAAALMPLALVPALLDRPEALMQAVALHRLGYDIALVFFGVNCLIMAVMLRWLMGPVLPLALVGSGLVYLAGSLTALIAPRLATTLQPAYLLPLVAETALCLWFILQALRPARAATRST
ncbi:DUF4386 domain-containing protein [Pseudodonghicola xiamenensis]|uniref:DUF4386 domain-containing protein n=1 Tax=Pseudodonghicola xiamenensis TaxID=337702 RepID=A0A8J3H693_9RHOB|nr:DUF4386 domain-containing protein [Pseudodonghicola xiamenensis]GHG86863.1 hypothetical protein GCM10010961_14820 [Pseudodonghicola xiamenensis]